METTLDPTICRVPLRADFDARSKAMALRTGDAPDQRTSSDAAGGFALIEVLVAVVVLSVGILGVLALQLNALAYSHSAYVTSVASVQAMDLEERMRANSAAADTYAAIDPDEIKASEASDACQAGDACSAEALAEYDMHRWVANTRRLFPATLKISLETAGAGVYELVLEWHERDRDDMHDEDEATRSLRYLFRLDKAGAAPAAGAT